MAHTSSSLGSSDQTVGRVKNEDIVRIEHGIERLAGLVFMHARQHRNPVGAVAGEMHEAFRSGDLRYRDGVMMPEMTFKRVVLPQPDGPSSA